MSEPRILRRANRVVWAVVLCCLAFSACGDGDGGGRGGGAGAGGSSLKELGVDDDASEGVKSSLLVDGTKDVQITLKTGAVVEVPAGAVTKDVRISVERPADDKARKLVENLKSPGRIASAPYVLTPHGTTFKQDVKVVLPIAGAKQGGRELSVAWLEDENDTSWKLLGLPKSDGDKAEITLKHFSVLLLVEGSDELAPMGDIGVAPEPDAGGGEPNVDPEDAGAEQADAQPMPALDAGDDLPMDAGTSVLRDAVAPAPVDAAPATEAAVFVDAFVPPPDAAMPNDAAMPISPYYARLQQCDLLIQDGAIQEPQPIGPYEACELNCLINAPCSDMRNALCAEIEGTDAGFSTSFTDCVQSCAPAPFTCPDASVTLLCDGEPGCTSGEDEANCGNLYFQCPNSGERIYSGLRCNGSNDCYFGDDELACPHHICTSDSLQLPPDVVCDGNPDCSDGSDEPPTCAQLVCMPPIGT